jgi:hypothetical protein
LDHGCPLGAEGEGSVGSVEVTEGGVSGQEGSGGGGCSEMFLEREVGRSIDVDVGNQVEVLVLHLGVSGVWEKGRGGTDLVELDHDEGALA